LVAKRSRFTANAVYGIEATDATTQIDSCTIDANVYDATKLDSGLFKVTNSFIYRNGGGLQLFVNTAGTQIEFNTIVDNGSSFAGIDCNAGSSIALPNNIVARNATNTANGSTCSFPTSYIQADIASLHFKHPDASPYDYHLSSGSVAIDMAAVSSVDHDVDGNPRPLGSGYDIGADEAQ
jgi:hypothetical protein